MRYITLQWTISLQRNVEFYLPLDGLPGLCGYKMQEKNSISADELRVIRHALELSLDNYVENNREQLKAIAKKSREKVDEST